VDFFQTFEGAGDDPFFATDPHLYRIYELPPDPWVAGHPILFALFFFAPAGAFFILLEIVLPALIEMKLSRVPAGTGWSSLFPLRPGCPLTYPLSKLVRRFSK